MTNVSSERILAFVPQWEYQCCGDPLDVGTERDLTLTQPTTTQIDSPLATPVTHLVEHHVPEGPRRDVRARIMELWEARCHYEERDGVRFPVAGSSEFTSVHHMEVWDGQWRPSTLGGRPQGWVVDLRVLADLPAHGGPYGQDA